MARADFLLDVIKYSLSGDNVRLRSTVEAICAEERAKQHNVLAGRLEDLLKGNGQNGQNESNIHPLLRNGTRDQSLFIEKIPKKRLEHLVLPEVVLTAVKDLIEEQTRSDLLRSYGVEPRNKILLIGPPGNGKTSLAEAIAEALMIPLLVVRYESIVGTYLGETAGRLSKLMDQVKTRRCVLFFDEFETLGKDRGDIHETGEIKRVVSSLLLHIDALPSYVTVIGATNHEQLLDSAAWRRFQLRLELPKPTRSNLSKWFSLYEKRTDFKFGLDATTIAKKVYGSSYSEAEELALSIYRQYILTQPNARLKEITNRALKIWSVQRNLTTHKANVEETE